MPNNRTNRAGLRNEWEVLKTAVSNRSWEEVTSLLRNNNYSSSSVEQFITACEHLVYGRIHVDREILSHCSSDQKDRLLKTALRLCEWSGEQWNEVTVVLQDSNYSSSSVEQFVAACEQYGRVNVDQEILSHCNSEQKDRFLKTAVRKERWEEVGSLLQNSNHSSSSVEQFVTVCEQYSLLHVDCEILSHCSSEQKGRLVKIAVKLCRGLQYRHTEKNWNDVKILLQKCNHSSSSVEQFVAACEQYEVILVDGDILSHCSSEQKDRLLNTAVKVCGGLHYWNMGKMWSDVKALLQDTNYSSSSVEHLLAACEQHEKVPVDGEILSHCSSEQKNRLLKTAVKLCQGTEEQNGRRCALDILLSVCNYSSSTVEQFIAACEQYYVIHAKQDLLSQCTTQQLDRLLTLATMKGEWVCVDNVLKAGGSPEKRVWAIVKACNLSDLSLNKFILSHIDSDLLSHCNTQQLNSFLTLFTKKGEWQLVEKMFKAGGSLEIRLMVIVKACHSVYCTIFDEYILPHINHDLLSQCSTQQLDHLLELATSQDRWQFVHKVLEAGGSHEKRVWVIERACLSHEDHDIYDYIQPHVNNDFLSNCNIQQLDSLLTAAATRRRWQILNILLKSGCSHERRAWAIEQACDPEGPLMTHYRRSFLHSTFAVLKVRSIQDTSFDDYILPHVNHDLLSHCKTEQLDLLLTTMTTVRRWDIIDKVLRAGGSHRRRVWVIKEACQRADHLVFQRYISSHCDGQLYKRGVDNPQSRLTVMISAMLNEHCPRKMVAECIRLGFSTHQPQPVLVTTAWIANAVYCYVLSNWKDPAVSGIGASPFLLAVLRGLPVVAHMLYESGSSSYSELMHLYKVMLDLSDPHTEEGRKLHDGEYLMDWQRSHYVGLYSDRYKAFMNTLTTFLPYLKEMASTPRSLESSCRLVFSHCLTVGGGRERAVQELPLPDGLKDYLLFSDLTDPDYQSEEL